MKLSLFCFFVLLPLPAAAAPVHVALKASAAASPNADGFISLGSVATLSGGDKPARLRFAAVLVARAPLPGETRQLTRGDLALKLRQAGINPDTQAVLEGADRADVTVKVSPAAQTGPGAAQTAEESAAKSVPAAVPDGPIIRPGDAVTICIQSGPMTITAPATARDSGRAGDTIRVHRDGVMTDLTVQVVDAQTVQLQI